MPRNLLHSAVSAQSGVDADRHLIERFLNRWAIMLCLPLPLWRHAHVFLRASNLVRFTSSGFTSTLRQTFVVHKTRTGRHRFKLQGAELFYASQDARAAIPRNPSRPQLCHLQFFTLRTLTHTPRCDVKSSNRSVPFGNTTLMGRPGQACEAQCVFITGTALLCSDVLWM